MPDDSREGAFDGWVRGSRHFCRHGVAARLREGHQRAARNEERQVAENLRAVAAFAAQGVSRFGAFVAIEKCDGEIDARDAQLGCNLQRLTKCGGRAVVIELFEQRHAAIVRTIRALDVARLRTSPRLLQQR